jgi:hypothetical protein
MEIVKQGDLSRLKKIKHFKCNHCECEFLADNTEYQFGGFEYNISYYRCKCPTCGNDAFAEG